MTFIAKYRGQCDDCDEDIEPGDVCAYRGDGRERVIVHVTCPTEVEIEDPVLPCGVCWLIHPEGACDV
ncbi:MAG: hypothetical protein LCH43_11390 [Actinobacteria bacterium]|nr:hypothetical protein [Actinomycetota bacterium]